MTLKKCRDNLLPFYSHSTTHDFNPPFSLLLSATQRAVAQELENKTWTHLLSQWREDEQTGKKL